MKKIILILIGCWVCLVSSAIERPIPLSCVNGNQKDLTKDNRSLTIAPTASHDGNVITIYSEKTLEGVGIYVVDAQGVILYSAEESALLGNYTFALDGHPKGTLVLVIQTNEEYYEGEFSLE